LLAKGRLEEGSQILETLARVNKNELPPSFKIKLEVLSFQDGGCKSDCKSRKLFEHNSVITHHPGTFVMWETAVQIKNVHCQFVWQLSYVGQY
jgi:hypothetical protein